MLATGTTIFWNINSSYESYGFENKVVSWRCRIYSLEERPRQDKPRCDDRIVCCYDDVEGGRGGPFYILGRGSGRRMRGQIFFYQFSWAKFFFSWWMLGDFFCIQTSRTIFLFVTLKLNKNVIHWISNGCGK